MDESDNSWIFDSLVGFLSGPVWNAPLQSFIEEKSLIFEPNSTDNPEYRKIFDEFKNLVDLMLGSYMEDIGITPLQFEEACNKGHVEFAPKHFDHGLFEQIWAANNYEMFKRMMTQRNVELQLQALELIEQKYGVTPQSFIPHKNTEPHVTGETKVEISPDTHDKPMAMEEEIMEEVIKKFPYEETPIEETDSAKRDEEVQYLLEEKHILQETLKNIGESSKTQTEVPKDLSKEKHKEAAKLKQEIKEPINIPTQDEIAFDKKPISTEIDRVELKKRQDYLRAQRDKLVALKKEARKKQLDVNNSSKDKIKSRPKSAKMAQAVLTGTTETLEIEDHQLQIRKALAERLRAEVIESSHDN